VQAAIVPPLPRVPILFDRARTDVLGSRRMVEETRRRLSEARSIIDALGPTPTSPDLAPWAARLDEAMRHLTVVEESLRRLLDREGSP
jgi:hypothetical protein